MGFEEGWTASHKQCNSVNHWKLEKTEEVFAYGIGNPGFWNPEYSSRNLESQLRLEVLLTNSGIRYLQSGIHGLESRIQDCP